MSPIYKFYRDANSKRSSALVITLVVLVLVTLLVVSLSSMIALERTSTHESFESQRAREFSTIAVDEVVALLHDSIPTNSMWAAAPGKIEFFPTPTSTTATTVPLYSGQATGTASSTGQVDLNAPVLGASISTYPIISTNAEYPSQTPMPMGWIEMLQDGTLVRPGSASSKDPNNPVVGRYAYWVDTETSKVNINTAGKGQINYNFRGGTFATNTAASTNDLQNLSGAPSRVDLSQLDGGITANQSLATYHYTYGGNWLPSGAGDYLGAPLYVTNTGSTGPLVFPFGTPSVPTNGPGASQGMERFASIQQWSQMTNDVITGAAVSALTAAQVEQNKFYLTTRSSTPEVTPWGFNKMWLQSSPVNSTNAWSATYGNKLNGKGAPIYPAKVSVAQTNSPPGPLFLRGGRSFVSENRYYMTPFLTNGGNLNVADFQYAGQFDGDYARTTAFINAMMVQLNRTDWPGFNGQSFVGKYGQAECEDLAFNILCLYDSAVHSGGHAPMLYAGHPVTNYPTDKYGYYGSSAQYTINGKSRLLSGVGEWPYLTQVGVTFVQEGSKGAPLPWTNAPHVLPAPGTFTNPFLSPYTGTLTVTYPSPATNVITYYTKFAQAYDGGMPGFVPSWPTVLPTNAPAGKRPVNMGINASAQIWYPPGFKNTYVEYALGSPWMVDVAVYAKGKYNGTNVTYGSTTVVDTEPGANNSTYHPYYWGVLDQSVPTTYTTNSLSPLSITTNNAITGQGFAAGGRPFWTPPSQYPTISSTTATAGSPAGYVTVTFPTIYIGPFDQSTQVDDMQLRCRFVMSRENALGNNCPTEIAPLGYNAVLTSTAANEDACFTNVMSGNSPTFVFSALSAGSPMSTGTNIASASQRSLRYELTDPRVYRYLTDWTMKVGPLVTNGASSVYASSYSDGLTGVNGDDSKLAWPDIGAGYFNTGLSAYTGGISGNSGDVRLFQNANNIVGFPGIGWLSVLPLNCESSQGTVSAGTGSGDPGNPGKPVPWRTLSLEPTPTTNGLPSGGKLPDWLLLEAFALAYDQTYCSQTEGKINVNAALSPQFPSGTTIAARTRPLQALIAPASYPTTSTVDLPALNAASIAADIAKGLSGSTYTAPYGSSGLPTDILMYPGQLCQFTSMAGTGSNQWQRESLMRSLAGVVTTQCSDFKVHVVAQAVKQVAFNGNPISDFVVTGEQRMSAIVSRVTNLGPDNIPDSGDEPVNATNYAVGSSSGATGVATSLIVGMPSFKYVISDINYINN